MSLRRFETVKGGLSLRARAFKLLLRLLRRKKLWASVEGMRSGIEAARRAGPARPGKSLRESADVQSETVAGCEVFRLAPRNAPGGEKLLYLHGGGYIRPITNFHWNFLDWLVRARRATVVVPLYPLAPESTCHETVKTVRQIHDAAVQAHGRFDAFIGDSAGAGLILALCQDLAKAGLLLPRRLVLITPWVDVAMKNPAIVETDKRDLMLGLAGTTEAGRLYAGDLPVEHPLVSPLHADLTGFPPMQIFVATDDIVHHDALRFAEKAHEAGVPVELHSGDGLMHVWPLLPITEAGVSREAIGKFLQPSR